MGISGVDDGVLELTRVYPGLTRVYPGLTRVYRG